MTGYILQTGGGSLGGHAAAAEKIIKVEEKKEYRQINLKRQLKGKKVAHKAVMAQQKLKDAGGEM